MLACGYMFAAMAGVVADRSCRLDRELVLPDVLFDVFPEIDTYGFYNDKAEMIFVGLAAPALLLEGKLQLAARQIYIIQAVLWILRAPAFLVTQMPNPYKRCVVDERVHEEPLLVAGLRVLRGDLHTCADVMFSGHAAGVTMFLLVTLKHLSSMRWKVIFLVQYIVTLVVMIMSRFHYTVDVYIGVLISAMTCIMYFQYSANASALEKRQRLFALMKWYERGV